MSYQRIDVRKLAGALGAEIRGVDLCHELSDETVREIRSAWLEHHVVFFRDQPLPLDSYLAFARRFGTPVEYPFIKGLPGYPEITPVIKQAHERVNFGGIWHSDTSYMECPPMASMLLARELPPFGGDTLFADMVAAYQALSPAMREMLDKMVAVNTSAKADVSKTREDLITAGGNPRAKSQYVAEHPVVRTHPESGVKALYVNIAHTQRFKDMTDEESAPLLAFLHQHQTRPEFTCRFVWQVGSIAFWDNRAVQHNPINDYHGYKRVMHRITLAGDRPR